MWEESRNRPKFLACVRSAPAYKWRQNRKGRTFFPVFASGNPNHALSLFVHTVMHSILPHFLLYRVPIMSGNGLGPGIP